METIKLNVSGKLIEVEKSTLLKTRYFENSFSDKFKQPADGIHFVPCSIDAFEAIIRYLRFDVAIDPIYEKEADYFIMNKDCIRKETEEEFTTEILMYYKMLVEDKLCDIASMLIDISSKIYRYSNIDGVMCNCVYSNISQVNNQFPIPYAMRCHKHNIILHDTSRLKYEQKYLNFIISRVNKYAKFYEEINNEHLQQTDSTGLFPHQQSRKQNINPPSDSYYLNTLYGYIDNENIGNLNVSNNSTENYEHIINELKIILENLEKIPLNYLINIDKIRKKYQNRYIIKFET